MASLRFKRLRRDNGHHSREHVQITGGLPPGHSCTERGFAA